MNMGFIVVVSLVTAAVFVMASALECNNEWTKERLINYLVKKELTNLFCGLFLPSNMVGILEKLSLAFYDDNVQVELLFDKNDIYCEPLTIPVSEVFLLFPEKKDRKCLLKPIVSISSLLQNRLKIMEYPVNMDAHLIISDLVGKVNSHCHLFRTPDGLINSVGRSRKKILSNLFSVSKSERQCTVIDSFDSFGEEAFFEKFLSLSKPVIFRGYAKSWPAFKKWRSLDFFNKKHLSSKRVHVKLSPSSNYEGVEPRSLWARNDSDELPTAVLNQLQFPNLVVVRPASSEMAIKQLTGVIKSISSGKLKNASAYLEYTPLDAIDQSLLSDAPVPTFAEFLELQVSNLWLSDGNTTGKLHFDGADNILVQLVGSKNLTLFDPHHNENLYEGHIQEAQFEVDYSLNDNGYSSTPWKFSRSKLLESTSMVMSPVDITKIDNEMFPNFTNANPFICTLEAGDALFMPAFWWHEVASKPCSSKHFNLAVNFWFNPFFTKEFPCANCRLDLNSDYYHLLEQYYKV